MVECFDGGERCVAHPVSGAIDNGGWNVFFLFDPARGVGNANTWLYMTQPGGPGEGFWRTSDAGKHWTRVFTNPMIECCTAHSARTASGRSSSPERTTRVGNHRPICEYMFATVVTSGKCSLRAIAGLSQQ